MELPEWNGYLSKDSLAAGHMTHRESGYVVEIAQEAAMRKRKNVWIDGSLRDGDWYSRVFDDLRRRHPEYRIAIFHVFVPWEVVCSRAASRAETTGRVVPEAELLASFQQVPKSVEQLLPLADFVAHIDNSDRPRLTKILAPVEGLETDSGNWDEVSNRFEVVPGLGRGRERDKSATNSFITRLITQNRVVVFSKTYCSYCTRAKRLLAEKLGPEGAHVVELDTLTVQGDSPQISSCIPDLLDSFDARSTGSRPSVSSVLSERAEPSPLNLSETGLQDSRARELAGVGGFCGVVMQHHLAQMTGIRTLPQIFIDATFIGGCEELLQLQSGGRLELLLSTPSNLACHPANDSGSHLLEEQEDEQQHDVATPDSPRTACL